MNRIALQTELDNLRHAVAWISDASRWQRKATPLLLVLAPLAGFLLGKRSGQTSSWFKSVVSVVKWIGPLYQLWRSFSSGRAQAEAEQQGA
jgi:hypothetical protein